MKDKEPPPDPINIDDPAEYLTPPTIVREHLNRRERPTVPHKGHREIQTERTFTRRLQGSVHA